MRRVKRVSRAVQQAVESVAGVSTPAMTRRLAAKWQPLRTLPDDIRPRIFFPVWIACGVACALLISVADSSNQAFYARLERSGVVVSAVVTRTEPSNHGIVGYRFVADGQTHFAAAPADSPNPAVEQIKPGDRLHVVYDARDPKYSCACDPSELTRASDWWRRLIGGLFLGAIVALVLSVSIKRTIDRRRAQVAGPVAGPE